MDPLQRRLNRLVVTEREHSTDSGGDSAVVSGSSSVDLSNAPAPRPRKPDLEAEAEQLTISPDEFDDICQTGVRARAALGRKLDAQEA